MKLKYKISSLLIAGLLLIGCNDSFLDKDPLDSLTTANPFQSTDEVERYLNQFYESAFRGHPGGVAGGGIAFDDQIGDNLAASAPVARIAGTSSLASASKLGQYTQIRSINYLLEHRGNIKGSESVIKNLLGEAYFFRALYYFQMVKNYGDVSWVNKVLPAEQSAMEIPRDSRLLIVDSILVDLDRATEYLQTQNSNVAMRVHRDVAYTLKSQVALYEGTWQKYHKAKGDDFYSKEVTDEKIKSYLTQARDAAKAVIDSKRWSIYTNGNPLSDYQQMFITLDLSKNNEVLLWKKYSFADKIGHSVTRYLNNGGGDLGVTLSLVDDYLTIDGKIFAGTERENAQKVYGQELSPTIRDPRLSQTVAMPGTRLKPESASNIYMAAYPPINISGFNRNNTGFAMLKFVEVDNVGAVTVEYSSEAPAIQYRYAEVLLNYAEALAELGGGESEIIKALQPLRDRVNMPSVDFDREYNTISDYPFRNLNKAIQVVRRERRIELALEGMRKDDIMRWAAADELLTGKRPLGILFKGSDLEEANKPGGFYEQNSGRLIYDENLIPNTAINLWLSGKTGDSRRYIDPYQRQYPDGLGFKLNRDYLLPIQERQISLTGGKWVQNPGW